MAEIVGVISSHVLDLETGSPGVGVKCTSFILLMDDENERYEWKELAQTVTDRVGRINNVHPGRDLEPGTYKIRFQTSEYLRRNNRPYFFPYVEVVFEINDTSQRYHVPITLSNFGYSTYKGQ